LTDVTSWKGKSRGNLLGYKIFVTSLKYAGLSFAYLLLRFVVFYYFIFAPGSFRNVFRFYAYRLHFGFFRSLVSVYRNYYAFGQVILDKVATMSGFTTNFTFNFEGENFLRQLAENQTGGLLISAHIGNFEMAGHLLNRLPCRVNIIMLDAEHEKIKAYLSTYTKRSFNLIPIREDNSHIRKIDRAMRNNELVCIHGDRFLPGSRTISARFLGDQALFPTGPFYLAMKYALPVSFVFAMKEGRKHYHFYATEPVKYSPQSSPEKRDHEILRMISSYSAEMEQKIRTYPYQWFNYYDFWKTN
jgi:predicted LPLAT superfamily acyltransferase